jgi:hypothetical protein
MEEEIDPDVEAKLRKLCEKNAVKKIALPP